MGKSQNQKINKNIVKGDIETEDNTQEEINDKSKVKNSNKKTQGRGSKSRKSDVNLDVVNDENVQSKNVKKNERNLRKKTDEKPVPELSSNESMKDAIENNESYERESKFDKRSAKKMLKRKSLSPNNGSAKRFKSSKRKNNGKKSNTKGNAYLEKFNSKKKDKEKEMKKKIEVAQESDDEGSDAILEEYEVEKLVDIYFKKNGDREFLVRWKGYSPKDDTWEPEKHLNCKELIQAFLKKCEEVCNQSTFHFFFLITEKIP